jgi:hypothetical protein
MLFFFNDTATTEIYTEHTNTLCGQNGEFMNVKLGDTQPPVQWVPGLSRG